MDEQQRGNWSSSLGFILAATGSAIGLGNLWKFPYITWDNDGGAFVLVYLLCIAAVGLPIMMAELIIGRKTQKSAVPAFKEAIGPAWGVVGLWGVLCGFILLSYYTVIAGWSLFYFWKSVQWSLGGFTAAGAMGDVFGQQVSKIGLQLGLSLSFSIATVGVVYFGIQKGIERVARIFLPILFGILLLLLVSALGMDGSGEALSFLFRPNFAELEPSSVLEALGHAFFTLSLGMGAMITYGSYLAKDQSIVKAAGWIVLLDTAIAIVASIIMFSVIFSVAGMREQVGSSPVGMLFISLPELFYTAVPFGTILAPLFYVLVAFAALTSTIAMLEVTVSYVIDEHRLKRSKATMLSGAAVFVFTICAALSFSDTPFFSTWQIFDIGNPNKMGWFATMDHFVGNWMLPTGGLAVTLAAGWFMTREETEAELVDGTEPAWFKYGAWRFFIRYVAPIAVAAIIIAVMLGVDFA
jgi:NSS family neurotransmitter:Na+ symporter